MKRVHMTGNRQTQDGLLRTGKDYYVPSEVAVELIAEGVAIDLDKPEPEEAVRTADEDAAVRTKRKPSTRRGETR